MNISLVGTGNVAVVLSQLLVAAGHSIVEVYGRNLDSQQRIFQLTGAEIKTNLREMKNEADVCLIAVSDAAIADVARQLTSNKSIVVHTSGATPKEALSRFANYGVLYPLQSLRKEMQDIPPIPFFIDANTKKNMATLRDLASSTGNSVTVASNEERLKLHVAAVLCSNFTNHLYVLTETFCRNENISFKVLLPLINETAGRLQYFPPAQLQTGPAIRHDEATMQRHLELLQFYPETENLYRILSAGIQAASEQ